MIPKKQPKGEPLHPDVKDVSASVSYLSPQATPPHLLAKLWVAIDHLVLFSRQSARYAGAVSYFFHNQPRRLFKYFINAGRLARELQRRQVDHLHAHFANVPAT